MTTNLSKLKHSKGTPPKAAEQIDVIQCDLRPGENELRPLQVRVPKSVFEAFSERAGREFGFSHGAKKKLFLKMWRAYEAQNTQT